MERLGRYEVVRPLASGGTGTVYEAVLHGPAGWRRRVALKVLHQGGDVLRREARIGGFLRHPTLVDVYEVGEVGGRWFAALELCPGGSLEGKAPLPPLAVVEVGLQVCAALEYAHGELGLVHLDLKPANLLLSGDRVKVADLGIAHAAGFDAHDGRIRGTPGYMPPEQARGEAVDARADVHALGVTLVELATGRRPGAALTTDWLDRQDDDPPMLDSGGAIEDAGPLRGTVPAWLQPAVDRCLEAHADDRWPDVEALSCALRGLRVGGQGLTAWLGVAAAASPEPDAGPDAFVGRERDLALLRGATARPGAVVVKGPPGIGKSRLARELAREWVEGGRAAFVCDVSEVSTLDGVVGAVASALGVPLGGHAGAGATRLAHALAARGEVLVVLDGCERCSDPAIRLIASWGAVVRDARVVATSRNAMPLATASEVDVGPLPPDDAAALLATRALQRGVSVALDPALPVLAERLEGVPLALELAAGRLGVLSVADVLERLSLSLLRSGSEGPHSTLRVALEWSFELLSEVERSALAQLSVFPGSFALEAAEAVLAGLPALEVLHALADRSLVSRTGDRLLLLGGTRELAAEQLGPEGGPAERHGRFYAKLGATEALAALDGPHGTRVRRQLALDLDNLVVACRRATARGDAAVADATLGAANAVLLAMGPLGIAVELAREVVAMTSLGPRARTRALGVLGEALRLVGQPREAEAALEEALRHARELGDRSEEASLLGGLACLMRDVGRVEASRSGFESALRLCEVSGDRAMRAEVLTQFAVLRHVQGQLGEAQALYEEALGVFRLVGRPRAEATTLGNLGLLHTHQGQPDEARRQLEAALRLRREQGNRREEAKVLGNLASALANLGRADEARAAHEAALALHREVGNRRSEGVVLGNLGMLHLDAGRPAEAATCLETALAVHREVENRRSEAVVLCYIGNLHREEGRPVEAAAHLDAALHVARASGSHRVEGMASTTLGSVLMDLERLDEARVCLETALRVHAALGDRRHEAEALLLLGEVDERAGRRPEAVGRIEAALAVHGEPLDVAFEGNALAALARLDAAAGDHGAARGRADRSVALLRNAADRGRLAIGLAARAEVLLLGGDPDAARAALAEAVAVAPERKPAVAAALLRARALVASTDRPGQPTG